MSANAHVVPSSTMRVWGGHFFVGIIAGKACSLGVRGVRVECVRDLGVWNRWNMVIAACICDGFASDLCVFDDSDSAAQIIGCLQFIVIRAAKLLISFDINHVS